MEDDFGEVSGDVATANEVVTLFNTLRARNPFRKYRTAKTLPRNSVPFTRLRALLAKIYVYLATIATE